MLFLLFYLDILGHIQRNELNSQRRIQMKILESCNNLVKLYIKLFKQSWRL